MVESIAIDVTIVLGDKYLPEKGEVYFTPDLVEISHLPVRRIWQGSLDDLNLAQTRRIHRTIDKAIEQQNNLNSVLYALIC